MIHTAIAAAAPTTRMTEQETSRPMLMQRKVAPQRVSESLDYQPVQNKLFYERMQATKDTERRRVLG